MSLSPFPADTPSIALYSCYHKQAWRVDSDIVQPIQVGSAMATERLPMLQDDEGENISAKNPHFCELTATYWIWKNSRADVVGLFHYRRCLNLRHEMRMAMVPDNAFAEKYGLTRERLEELFTRFDAILPLPVLSKGKSTRQHYAQRHVGSDLELCLSLIAEQSPDMAETAREFMDNPHELGYFGNIIICRKPLCDEYAAWLFRILFEVERRIHADVLTRDAYQQRVYGFLSERLMTIFIKHKIKTAGIRVGEAPILQLTDNEQEWKRYLGKRKRHRLLQFLGINKRTWEENIKSTI